MLFASFDSLEIFETNYYIDFCYPPFYTNFNENAGVIGMEPLHYKILKILDKQPGKRMSYFELKKHFPNIADDNFRALLSVDMGDVLSHSYQLEKNGDFLIAMTPEGGSAFCTKRYANFINKRTLWKNRILSFIFGALTTVTAKIITDLIISGQLSQWLHRLFP